MSGANSEVGQNDVRQLARGRGQSHVGRTQQAKSRSTRRKIIKRTKFLDANHTKGQNQKADW